MASVERPPPAHILLAYAADGWATENGRFNPSGRPKPPDPAAWGPVARTLLKEPGGLDRLRDLAQAGMAAWAVDPSIIACVAPAFASPEFAVRLAWRLGMRDYREPRVIAVEPIAIAGEPAAASVPLVAPSPKPFKP